MKHDAARYAECLERDEWPGYAYPLVTRIARTLDAYFRCIETGNEEWLEHHKQTLKEYEDLLPSGSGFDQGTQIDFDRSKPNRFVLTTSYHHMNENGFYDGWTEHDVIVTPSLLWGFDLRVTGRNRNDIKEYIAEIFQEILSSIIRCKREQ